MKPRIYKYNRSLWMICTVRAEYAGFGEVTHREEHFCFLSFAAAYKKFTGLTWNV